MKIIDKNLVSPFLSFMNHEIIAAKNYCYYESIDHAGENRYKYLIILDHGGPEILPGNFRNVLMDIHQVVQKRGHTMTEAGMAIVNIGLYPGITLRNLHEKLEPKYITLWGNSGEKLGVQLKPFSGKFYESARILQMPSTVDLISDAGLQAQSKQYLKFLFNIQ